MDDEALEIRLQKIEKLLEDINYFINTQNFGGPFEECTVQEWAEKKRQFLKDQKEVEYQEHLKFLKEHPELVRKVINTDG